MTSTSQDQPNLDVVVKDYADCRVVSVSGRIDHTNSTGFLESLKEQAETVTKDGGMVVDLEKLDFITSAGLRALLLAHRTAAGAGARLIVTGIDGVVKEVFRISKFDSLLSVADTTEQAVSQISAPAAKAFAG